MEEGVITEEGVVKRRRKEDRMLEVLAGGSMAKAIGGAGAIVLSILGLAKIYPSIALAIAAIAVGISLVFEGGDIAARYSKILQKPKGYETVELGGGLNAEFFGGAGGIVLGILALVGVAPLVLMPVATILFGASLLLGSSVSARLNAMIMLSPPQPATQQVLREAASTASGTQVMVGLAGITLGILALVGAGPVEVLTLIGLLSIGFSVLLSGTAVSSKMISIFLH